MSSRSVMRVMVSCPMAGGAGSRVHAAVMSVVPAPQAARAAASKAADVSRTAYEVACESPRCHAQVQLIFFDGGGNMWKYMATIIGMNTMVL